MDVGTNREVWERTYDWSQQGEEWSEAWGSSSMQWFGTLLPRLHAFLPADVILEIAPGHGRWTHFLKSHCRRLIAVDLSQRCVDACTKRFAGDPHVELHRNDGRSLDMVTDGTIDLVFSFDSLVHANADVLDGYLSQIARKLRPDGIAFIHHSNLAPYASLAALSRRVPARICKQLAPRGLLVNLDAARSEDVSAEGVATMCRTHGLRAISQELVDWGSGRVLMDCISLITREGSSWDRPTKVVRNPGFFAEARRLARLTDLYPARRRPA